MTNRQRLLCQRGWNFNPHLPCGRWRAFLLLNSLIKGNFNPHLPCGRWLIVRKINVATIINFNPHLPCGRWQTFDFQSIVDYYISIHTFRVEGDVEIGVKHKALSKFQSTPSVWKVTNVRHNNAPLKFNFNPHLPCGRWQADTLTHSECYQISIHTFRVEGDDSKWRWFCHSCAISIHTFRVEGDKFLTALK